MHYTSSNGYVKKRKWLMPLFVVGGIFFIIGGLAAWKAGFILSKISTEGGGSLLQSITHAIPGVRDVLKGEEEGRINIVLLGMRGENLPGGGTLTDTIMVASIKPQENKVALVSVPRDLWVKNPGTESYSKINAVHAYGEENGKEKGISQMEKVLEEVLGQEIHYGARIDFEGFKELVDSLGGIEIHLDNNFSEPSQFMGIKGRCDDTTFVVPTGQTEEKKVTRRDGSIGYRHFPLCYTKDAKECGGNFTLKAGDIALTGEQALCLARARETSSDFDRARRQQMILQAIQKKATSLGTLSDFTKVNAMLDVLGNSVKTDMAAWEMKSLYNIYKGMENPEITQKVLENSEEGLLYAPQKTPERGYTLEPRGDNYDRIHEMFRNVFSLPAAQTEPQA
ncbi:MAG TPA: LCP family protein [Candidatus Moranbacteria bacterium]|nr:LCP family protein [Candidatus Moranbacteria bacterium]HQB59233.1 LCP family protein [Candidatus Moranbacteria bacterium]